ncbi:uncharacterized protein UV8b_03797 [Ustilaginoidea virens]|uniref:Uncharacterized protein n=1 Tax=Ustilaginoidea virens TaxID=1159556 RepID=A0A8E5HQ62_USTVR|nr:uncharacterized protein UV8b_03797 [Ustilaginoidea virens]QUC19556.1 hypothetical protein UV8b_03797 [Ustilaginoidea virens]
MRIPTLDQSTRFLVEKEDTLRCPVAQDDYKSKLRCSSPCSSTFSSMPPWALCHLPPRSMPVVATPTWDPGSCATESATPSLFVPPIRGYPPFHSLRSFQVRTASAYSLIPSSTFTTCRLGPGAGGPLYQT